MATFKEWIQPEIFSNGTFGGADALACRAESAGDAAWRIFTDDSNDWSSSIGRLPTWIAWSTKEPIKISAIDLRNTNYSTSYVPTEYQVQASADGTNWVNITDVIVNTVVGYNSWQPTIHIPKAYQGFYRFYRLWITKCNSSSSYVRIRQMKITALSSEITGKIEADNRPKYWAKWIQPYLFGNDDWGHITCSTYLPQCEPFRAAQNNEQTQQAFGWATNGYSRGWWKWEFPVPLKVNRVIFINRKSADRDPNIVFQQIKFTLDADVEFKDPILVTESREQKIFEFGGVITNELYFYKCGGIYSGIGEVIIDAEIETSTYGLIPFNSATSVFSNNTPVYQVYSNGNLMWQRIELELNGTIYDGGSYIEPYSYGGQELKYLDELRNATAYGFNSHATKVAGISSDTKLVWTTKIDMNAMLDHYTKDTDSAFMSFGLYRTNTEFGQQDYCLVSAQVLSDKIHVSVKSLRTMVSPDATEIGFDIPRSASDLYLMCECKNGVVSGHYSYDSVNWVIIGEIQYDPRYTYLYMHNPSRIVSNALNSVILYGTDVIFGYAPDYPVRNGCTLYLDALNNTGYGHSDQTTTWRNLADDTDLNSVGEISWEYQALELDAEGEGFVWGMLPDGELTLELVFTPSKEAIDSNMTSHIVSDAQAGGIYAIYTPRRSEYEVSESHGFGAVICEESSGAYSSSTFCYLDSEDYMYANETMYAAITIAGGKARLFTSNSLDFHEIVCNDLQHNPNPDKRAPLAIGFNPAVDGSYQLNQFFGKIHSVRIYNRALSKEEIRHNYQYEKDRYFNVAEYDVPELDSNGTMGGSLFAVDQSTYYAAENKAFYATRDDSRWQSDNSKSLPQRLEYYFPVPVHIESLHFDCQDSLSASERRSYMLYEYTVLASKDGIHYDTLKTCQNTNKDAIWDEYINSPEMYQYLRINATKTTGNTRPVMIGKMTGKFYFDKTANYKDLLWNTSTNKLCTDPVLKYKNEDITYKLFGDSQALDFSKVWDYSAHFELAEEFGDAKESYLEISLANGDIYHFGFEGNKLVLESIVDEIKREQVIDAFSSIDLRFTHVDGVFNAYYKTDSMSDYAYFNKLELMSSSSIDSIYIRHNAENVTIPVESISFRLDGEQLFGTLSRCYKVPVLTSYGTVGGNEFAVQVSSVFNDGGSDVDTSYGWKATNPESGRWQSNNSQNMPQWLTYYFPIKVALKHFVLNSVDVGDNETNYLPGRFSILVSDDNINWIEVYQETTKTYDRNIERDVAKLVYANYIRVRVDETQGSTRPCMIGYFGGDFLIDESHKLLPFEYYAGYEGYLTKPSSTNMLVDTATSWATDSSDANTQRITIQMLDPDTHEKFDLNSKDWEFTAKLNNNDFYYNSQPTRFVMGITEIKSGGNIVSQIVNEAYMYASGDDSHGIFVDSYNYQRTFSEEIPEGEVYFRFYKKNGYLYADYSADNSTWTNYYAGEWTNFSGDTYQAEFIFNGVDHISPISFSNLRFTYNGRLVFGKVS